MHKLCQLIAHSDEAHRAEQTQREGDLQIQTQAPVALSPDRGERATHASSSPVGSSSKEHVTAEASSSSADSRGQCEDMELQDV
jgi:hypothetical protein